MDTKRRNRLLTLGTAIGLLVGTLLVVLGDNPLPAVGVVLIILSAMVFMYDVKVLLLDTSERART